MKNFFGKEFWRNWVILVGTTYAVQLVTGHWMEWWQVALFQLCVGSVMFAVESMIKSAATRALDEKILDYKISLDRKRSGL